LLEAIGLVSHLVHKMLNLSPGNACQRREQIQGSFLRLLLEIQLLLVQADSLTPFFVVLGAIRKQWYV
jgi:hypothetical protein